MEKLQTMADALELVRQEHPDATMSKLRFLEIRGVINTLVDADGQKWVKAGEVARALVSNGTPSVRAVAAMARSI